MLSDVQWDLSRMQNSSTPIHSWDVSGGTFKTDFGISSVRGEEKKKRRRFFESKVTLEKSSDIFLHRFQIGDDDHKELPFGAE